MRTRIKSYEQLVMLFKKRMKGVTYFDGTISEESFFKKYFFFRGQANSEWRLIPRFNRGESKEDAEIDISDTSRHGVFAQMYGRSSKVLDFTSDLKLALYYACKDERYKDVDGRLYVAMSSIWNVNKFASAIARHIVHNNSKYKENVMDIAYAISRTEEVQNLLNEHGFPSEDILTYLCIMINDFLRYGTLVIFDKETYEKYPKIKKERGAIYYCGPKIYEKRRKGYKGLEILTSSGRASSPNYCYRLLNSPHPNSDFVISYKILKEYKDSILKEIEFEIYEK